MPNSSRRTNAPPGGLSGVLDEAHRVPSESLSDGAWSSGPHALALGMVLGLKHDELLALGPLALPAQADQFTADRKFDDLFAIFVDQAAAIPVPKVLTGLVTQARTTRQLALFSPDRPKHVPQFGEADREGGPIWWQQVVHHRKELIEKHGAIIVRDDAWLNGSPPTLAVFTTDDMNTLSLVAAKVNMRGKDLKALNAAYLAGKGVDGIRVDTVLSAGWAVW